MKVELFSESTCLLGEGSCWNHQRNSLFWVDILEGNVFEKSFERTERKWELDCFTSAVFEVENSRHHVWVLSDKGLLLLSLEDGCYRVIHPLRGLKKGVRTNDAGIDPEGRLVYGTMYCDPQNGIGGIYRLNLNGSIDSLLSGVRIPNTFQWSANGSYLYSADSYNGVMFRYSYVNGELSGQTEFFSLASDEEIVPDGSAFDGEGFLWSACWNGSSVHRYDVAGRVIEKLALPVTRPTSCTFNDVGALFITTAKVGLTAMQLDQEPMAGRVFIVQTPYCAAKRPLLKLMCNITQGKYSANFCRD